MAASEDRPLDSAELRVLAAIGESTLDRTALVRRAGEPHSVLKAITRTRASLFGETGDRFALSDEGRRALADARRMRGLGSEVSNDALIESLRALGARRGPIRRDLDQVYATPASVARRARFLVSEGAAVGRLLLLGDDDLTSAALARLLGSPESLTVLELDPALVGLLGEQGVPVHGHDLREPLPRSMRGTFDAVFTDPPYAIEGFGLFVARAIEALSAEGVLYLAYGASRRAPDRALAKQRLLADCGLVIREVRRDFTEYEGAESIGARSDLWVLRKNPQTKPPKLATGELYTRRKPAGEKG